MNKTGTDVGVRADCGLASRDGVQVAYAAIANWDEASEPTLNLVMADMRAIGIVLIMVGLTWFALGSGFLGGSVMSGQVIWAVIGVAVAIGGGFVLYRGIPRR